jgi:hypothetical protein
MRAPLGVIGDEHDRGLVGTSELVNVKSDPGRARWRDTRASLSSGSLIHTFAQAIRCIPLQTGSTTKASSLLGVWFAACRRSAAGIAWNLAR